MKSRLNTYLVIVFDSCRYDSFLPARPKILRKLGRIERRDGYFGHGPMQHPKVLETPFVEGKIR